jgi:hypothetical protein
MLKWEAFRQRGKYEVYKKWLLVRLSELESDFYHPMRMNVAQQLKLWNIDLKSIDCKAR